MAAWRDNLARVEAPAAPRTRPRPRPRPQARRRPAMLGGVLWIAVLAALLGGIVAVNVAALQLNVRLDQLARERLELRATNATLSAQLSTSDALPQIQRLASKRLGLVPATPEQTTYVRLRPEK